jgi:preprotein translocase subunit SecF
LLAVSLEIARLWNSKILSLIYFAPLSFLYLFGGNLLDLRLFYLFLGMLTGYFASIKNLSVQA